MNSEPVIEVTDLKKSFGNNAVLKGFTFKLNRCENIVVLGKSGSGKSVLIKCIIGLVKPDSGTVKVLGQDVQSLDRGALDVLRAKVGFLFQSNALYDSMTVRENLEFPLRRHGLEKSRAEVDALVRESLQNVGLEHTLDMMPAALSGGMKKRVALARTLILRPEIILYDEPTTGLDPITGKEISELMKHLSKKFQTSSIVISHDMSCVKSVADRVLVLVNGICHADGTYASLKTSRDPDIHSFFD